MIGNQRDAIKGKGARGFPTEMQQGGFLLVPHQQQKELTNVQYGNLSISFNNLLLECTILRGT